MVEIMHWFYRLTKREKLLFFLSVVTVLSAAWLYVTESIEKEKQWYLLKIQSHNENLHKINQSTKKVMNVAVGSNYEYKGVGDILAEIKHSLNDKGGLQLLSLDIDNNKNTIVLKGGLPSLNQYLSTFNKKYPNFNWHSIDYRLVNSIGMLELKTNTYKKNSGHL